MKNNIIKTPWRFSRAKYYRWEFLLSLQRPFKPTPQIVGVDMPRLIGLLDPESWAVEVSKASI